MPMGFSFQPGADQVMGQANGQGGKSVSAPDSSVKVLSFRMPKRDVPIAPQALLQGAGGGAAGMGGLSPQILALLMSAFSAGPRGLTGPSQGPFDTSSDPAGVVGPSRPLTPKFTIGEGGRLPMDLGPAFAAAGPFGGDVPQMGGMPTGQPPTSSVSPGPRYKFDAGGMTSPSEGHGYGNDGLEFLGHRLNPDSFR
jgi:hypothetical protein